MEHGLPPMLWHIISFFPEDTGDFFVIVEAVYHHRERNEDHGHEGRLPDTGTGGGTGAVRAGAQQQRAGDNDHRLAQFVGKIASGKKHTRPILAGHDGVILGKIGKDG